MPPVVLLKSAELPIRCVKVGGGVASESFNTSGSVALAAGVAKECRGTAGRVSDASRCC